MKKQNLRKKLENHKIIISTLIVIILLIIGYFGYNLVFIGTDSFTIPTITIGPQEEVYELSLIMAGDNLIHSSLYNDAHKNANYNGYDFKPMYTYLKEIVSNYDLAYYNQETILGGKELGLSSYPAFNSPYEVGDAMIDAGFNLVSLATNHTLDKGETGVINSYNYWKNKEEVMTAGSYTSFEERNSPQIMEKNNITYSLLSYTYGTNGIPVPSGKEYLVNLWPTSGNNPNTDTKYQEYKEIVKEDIERVRDKVDVLMIAMHWGVEYTHTPTAYQKDMASFLADSGVDIIIGSHSHVVMPVTWIDDTLVIYSLGNLLSAQTTQNDYNTMVGLLTSIKITKKVKDNESKIELSNLQNELLFTYYNNWSSFKVVPFSNPDIKNYISDYERLYNKYSAVIKNIDASIPVASLN